MPEQLANAPQLPVAGAHVWEYFAEMHCERGNNGMSVSRITAENMKDWCWATGNTLDLWERRAIRLIDAAWMEQKE